MKKTSPETCPECGRALPPDSQHQLCPACLIEQAIISQTQDDGKVRAAPLPPPSPEEIAVRFPQLEILECLGRGGMGVVYKARQKSLNRIVALKLLAPERVNDPVFAERFTREAQALAALNHPNIVTIHDFGQTEGFYFLLMEFVDGVDLRRLLKSRKLTPEEALAIVPPLCEALQFAHERGIVHRDIKPANILLDQTGRVKIADFGIARIMDTDAGEPNEGTENSTATRGAVGTPGYSAPEQKHSPGKVDSRADIYSLGVVLYEMLTGSLPGKPIDPPSRRVQVDVRLDEIVLRALESEPEKRFQAADTFRTEVETYSENHEHVPALDTPVGTMVKRFLMCLYVIAAVFAVGSAFFARSPWSVWWGIAAIGFAICAFKGLVPKRRDLQVVVAVVAAGIVLWAGVQLDLVDWLRMVIWREFLHPQNIGIGDWILLGIITIGLILVTVPSSLGATWIKRLRVVLIFGGALWTLENGLFLLTHLRALGPGRPLVHEMDVVKGIAWSLAAIGLTIAGVKRLLQNRSESGASNRLAPTVMMSSWAFVLCGAGLLGIMNPQPLDTPLVSEAPAGGFKVTGSTWRSTRAFGNDFLTYRFKLLGYGVSHGPRQEIPVRADMINAVERAGTLDDLLFGRHGEVRWGENRIELGLGVWTLTTFHRPEASFAEPDELAEEEGLVMDEMDREILEIRLRQAEAELDLARQQHAAGQSGEVPDPGKVEVLRAQLSGASDLQIAELKLAAAERKFELAQVQFEAGRISKSEFQALQFDVELAAAELRKAQQTEKERD